MHYRPEFSTTAQYHILRHFDWIDEDYRKILKSKTEYKDEDINAQLMLSGSKFKQSFAENPLQLWNEVLNHPDFEFPDSNKIEGKTFVIRLSFGRDNYPNGIGTDSLVGLHQLLPEEKTSLIKKERSGFMVNHIHLKQKNTTWDLNLIFWKDINFFVKTIFPGIYAPPFPDAARQSNSEFTENESFWEQHAFVF